MSTSRALLRSLAEGVAPIVDLVYPPRCPACGEGVGSGGGLCVACFEDLQVPVGRLCAACQRPLGEGLEDGEALCAPCLAAPPRHDGIAAATLYGETSRKLVLAFKHGGRIALAPMLARMIAARLLDPDPARLLIPVPLHFGRLWRRGFNQSGLLARELEKLGHGTVLVDGLVRRRSTPSLGGMGAKARRRVLSGAISVHSRRGERIAGSDVILVDDVLTSGATSDACVAALRKAGAASVRIACFARVL